MRSTRREERRGKDGIRAITKKILRVAASTVYNQRFRHGRLTPTPHLPAVRPREGVLSVCCSKIHDENSKNRNQPIQTSQATQSFSLRSPSRASVSVSPLTFLPRPDQDGLSLAQQGVRGDGEEQAQAGRRPEGLRGRRPRARREAPQQAEVSRELAKCCGEASAARLSSAEAGVPVGPRGREVLRG